MGQHPEGETMAQSVEFRSVMMADQREQISDHLHESLAGLVAVLDCIGPIERIQRITVSFSAHDGPSASACIMVADRIVTLRVR